MMDIAALARELNRAGTALKRAARILTPTPTGLGSARFWELPADVQDALVSSRTYHPDTPIEWGDHDASQDPARPGFVHALSIKPDFTDPEDMVPFLLAVNEQARSRPAEVFVVMAYHEPENNIEDGQYTVEEFHTIQRRLHLLCTEPNVVSSVCLMAWDWQPASGRDPLDYVPYHLDGRPAFDVLGIDMYDPFGNDPLDTQISGIVAWRDEHVPDVGLALMEFATHTPYHRTPRNGRPETWDGPVRTDEEAWTEHVLELVEGWVCACWFNSWVGGKGPWWMPDTIQHWAVAQSTQTATMRGA